ncbi:Tom37 C-terminal domain-domain-containing protein [Aspergillus taichungensis]|uniref:Tom37 C-terminal domain-domain-containing protein n=1 Tax=Aspergillus taichungensis TaxID=482145 RepID=A0A2J5HV33_9EURO|nr:Tom37 C-terminal domain-domain-containing protein [Aspergillus taichungensis]
MVLELHVWGPAFSLPSIDPQCLATIAYFSLAVPKDAWVLVASSDPSVSPTNELPALKNGPTWVSQFRNIVDYLRQYSDGAWDLDSNLNALETADNTAFSSFLESRAQPLIDLSLYVSSQNYWQCTSPAYGDLLQWPNQWLLPPRIHSAAKARTAHLGLSALDLDAMEDQRKRDHSAAVAAGKIPANFIQRPRDTVSKLLGRTSHQSQFRLEALTGELFEPLEAMLGEKDHLLTADRPTSLDCLATGYLALALVPELTFPWLRDAMQSKAHGLTTYTQRMCHKCYGTAAVKVADAYPSLSPSPSPSHLPWQTPERARLATVGYTLLNSLADNTPILSSIRAQNRLRQAVESSKADLSDVEREALAKHATGMKKDVLVSVAAAVGGVVALLGYMVQTGFFSPEDEEEYVEEEYEEEPFVIDAGEAPDAFGVMGL